MTVSARVYYGPGRMTVSARVYYGPGRMTVSSIVNVSGSHRTWWLSVTPAAVDAAHICLRTGEGETLKIWPVKEKAHLKRVTGVPHCPEICL
jgi:hypothetical protein